MLLRFLKFEFLGNTILAYLGSILFFLLGIAIIRTGRRTILKKLKVWAKKTATTIDDFLLSITQKILVPLAYFGVFYGSVSMLSLTPLLKKIIDITGIAILTFSTAYLFNQLTIYGLQTYWRMKRGRDTALDRSLKGVFKVIKVLIWSLSIIFFLDNIGFKISTVIAGLGVGGVAIAIASQTILKDLFSYISILFDRPFEVGDFIIVDNYLGTVEYIGIKTTRIRSLSGEELIFSNTDLTDSRVRNYKRMQKRRVVFRLGVTYQTPLEKLKKIPVIIENIIKNVNDAIFDRAHFFSYGDFSLIFEIVYYVLGSDYNKYMDIQQEINFAIKEAFEQEKIEFAYPTQTIYLSKSEVE